MSQLGIFAKTFARPTLAGILDAVLAHGLKIIHFNYSCVGPSSMPDEILPALTQEISRQTKTRGIKIAGVSGTYNMIDPDTNKRKIGLKRLRVIIQSCHAIDTSLVSLCTGTRDPKDMWREHPDNSSPEAWAEFIAELSEALRWAEESGVQLGIEPEFANVIDSPRKARRLLDQMSSKNLKIILDPANIFRPADIPAMDRILDEAFDLLKGDIVMAHAKDFILKDGAIHHVAAGKGLLNYEKYLKLLQEIDVPLIMHGLSEEEVDGSMEYITKKHKV